MFSDFSGANLRCNIVWRPTEGGGFGFSKHVLSTHAEVSNLYVPIFVQHHVVQLQVSWGKTNENMYIDLDVFLLCGRKLNINLKDASTEWLSALTCRLFL